jgi:hypothetical protein
VTAFEVFEHFELPPRELSKMLTLAPNILISTELIPEPLPRCDDWWYFGLDHGQHIGFFRLKTLEFLAKRNGYYLTSIFSYHLFTKKPISKTCWKILVISLRIAHKLSDLFNKLFFRLNSKTDEDFKIISKSKK